MVIWKSVDVLLHVFPVQLLYCFIAMVKEEVKEAGWGGGNGPVVIRTVNFDLYLEGLCLR